MEEISRNFPSKNFSAFQLFLSNTSLITSNEKQQKSCFEALKGNRTKKIKITEQDFLSSASKVKLKQT